MKEIHNFAVKWLDKFRNQEIDYIELVDHYLADDCDALGFEMDSGEEFSKRYGSAVYDYRELQKIIDYINDIELLGSAIYSRWRYFNHWAYDGEEILELNNRSWFILALNRLVILSAELDNDIYRESNNLSDIRIVNSKDEFVPYYIDSGYDETVTVEGNRYHGEKIAEFYKNNDCHIDFKVDTSVEGIDDIDDTDGIRDIVVNYIDINIDRSISTGSGSGSGSGSGFARDIQIYGSYDSLKWDYIKDDNIYFISNSNHKLTVSFGSELKYQYYKIVVLDNIGRDSTRIKNIEVYKEKEDKNKYLYELNRNIEYTLNSYVDNNTNKNKTDILLNNKDKLKIYNVNIEYEYGEVPHFHRNYLLYCDDSIVNGSYISDFNNTINIASRNIQDKQIKIEIDDGDDSPIKITGINIDYYVDRLVFNAKESEKYKILVGNSGVEEPHYDIVYQKHEHDAKEQVSLGGLIERGDFKESDTKDKITLNVVVIITSIALAIIIISLIIDGKNTGK